MSDPDQRVLLWQKSSYSNGLGGECIEVAIAPEGLLIRDTKDPDGPTLELTPAAARRLLDHLRAASL